MLSGQQLVSRQPDLEDSLSVMRNNYAQKTKAAMSMEDILPAWNPPERFPFSEEACLPGAPLVENH